MYPTPGGKNEVNFKFLKLQISVKLKCKLSKFIRMEIWRSSALLVSKSAFV